MAVRTCGGGGWKWLGGPLFLAFVLATRSGPVAFATCGDGVWDVGEACDAGAANGTNGCCTATCTLLDQDYDGLCDARDLCSKVLRVTVRVSRLRVSRLGGVVGDERYRVSATMTAAASPSVDPATHGLRLLVTDFYYPHDVVLDAAASGGSGWTRTPDGSAWLYRNRPGDGGGVTRADVRVVTADPPTLAVTVQGWGGNTGVVPSGHQAFAMLALDAEGDQCGESILNVSRCRFRRGGRLTCEPPPPIRSCAGVLDTVACDTRNCASAQEHYFLDNNTYYSGDCTGLPGFVASPGVVAVTAGTTTDFAVAAYDLATEHACNWSSYPGPGYPNLECLD